MTTKMTNDRMLASAWCLLPRHRLLGPCRDKRHANPQATRSGCEPTHGALATLYVYVSTAVELYRGAQARSPGRATRSADS